MADAADFSLGVDASRAAGARLTGTERYSRRIIEGLLALGSDHPFRLYLNARRPLEVPLRARDRHRLLPLPRLWTHGRLSAELVLHPVDALFVPAHVVPLLHPRATVVTIHDLGYRAEPEAHTRQRRLALEWTTRWSVRAAQRVIAISRTTRDDLVRHCGVPSEKIDVIHHGVEPAFQPAPGEAIDRARARYGLPGRFVLAVGTIQPRKNLRRLIEAFGTLAVEEPELGLVVAGQRGWLDGEIDRAIAACPAGDRILLTGHVDEADLPALYSAAAVVAMPSLYEGFGLPVLEALACGTPAVISDRGALPEAGGQVAITVDPLDPSAIASGIQLALDPVTRTRRVAAGQEWARRFTWERAARQTLQSIERAWRETRLA